MNERGTGRFLREKSVNLGEVYFVQADSGPIKIGWAVSARDRLPSLQTGCPEALALVGTVPGTKGTEASWHARFAHLRIRGEWFWPGDDLADAIEVERQWAPPESRMSDDAFLAWAPHFLDCVPPARRDAGWHALAERVGLVDATGKVKPYTAP